MSLDSFGSNESEDGGRSVANSLREDFEDELLGPNTVAHNQNTDLIRTVNFILDHSAFVRGIGNIKRWFNEEYVRTNLTHRPKEEQIELNIYIPTYTLHEFDFVKKGTSMMATNAREAIRFIDKVFELEEQSFGEPQTGPIARHLLLESPREAGPNWEKCSKYKVHTPIVREFPNFKTKFDSNLLGQNPVSFGNRRNSYNNVNDLSEDFSSSFSIRQSNKLNDIQYENSASYQNALANSDQAAVMPTRLRYLIRSCIYKRFIEKSKSKKAVEEWKLITEDSITKIWARSYGLDCLNVNEAEVLLFQNHDVNSFKLYNPHNSFAIEDEYDHESNILQSTIDTTQYSYTSTDKAPGPKSAKPKEFKRRGKKKSKSQQNKIQGVVSEGSGVNGDYVKRERFDAINYAPRGTGELWKP